MPPPLLLIRGLRHRYGQKTALNVPHFTLNAGDIVLLAGDNGAGKSTLLKIIAGLLPPTHCDQFAYAGKNTPPTAPTAVYVHQTPHMFAASVRANVEYGLKRCNRPLSAADAAMAWAGIHPLANRPATRLSGGEQRRVALARARALHPRLYLLDEPTAHLDADGKRRVTALIRALRTEGATAIISSHDRDLPTTAIHPLQKP